MKNKRKFSKTLRVLFRALLITTVLLTGLTVMLFYKPNGYEPLVIGDANEVSTHLTHEILPALHNNLQAGEPFELVLTQEAVSDIIARGRWPRQISDGLAILAPRVYFGDGAIVVMAQVELAGRDMVVTAAGSARLDEERMLNLRIDMVKLGSVGVRPIAMSLAEEIYQGRLAEDPDGIDKTTARIIEALLYQKVIEPIFKWDDIRARITGIRIEQTRLTLRLSPQ